MKFDAQLIKVLKNFSTINKAILFKPGSYLETMTPLKTIKGRAKLDTPIPEQFAIYDLSEFLGVLSLFNDPEITVQGEQTVTVTENRDKITYRQAALNAITYPEKEGLAMPSKDVEFDLSADTLNRLLKAAAILKAPEIAVRGDGKNVYVETKNTTDETKDFHSIQVGTTDKNFVAVVRLTNFMVVPADYHVTVSMSQPIKLIHLHNEAIEYWVVIEAKPSKWEN